VDKKRRQIFFYKLSTVILNKMAETSLKVVKLLLTDGTLEGQIDIIDEDSICELLSSPRNQIEIFLQKPETDASGIYLLLSQNKVYVGQAANLKSRINQHIIGKNWWERVVILTTKDNSFDHADIDYLESVFIEKSFNRDTLDSENKNKGITQKINKFRQPILDKYVQEALFLLQLIGVTVFSTQKKGGLLQAVPHKSQQEIELRCKGEVAAFLKGKGVIIGDNFSYTAVNDKNGLYWINPKVECVDSDWVIALNDQKVKQIKVLRVPKHSFALSKETQKGYLLIRKDRPAVLEIKIEAKNLTEKRTGCDFSPFVTETISY